MRRRVGNAMELIAVGLTLLVLDIGGAGAGHGMDWDGTLVFSEDFNGDALRNYYWESEEGCEEVRQLNMVQDCFLRETQNLEVSNGTLIIRAGMIEYDGKVLYTTGRVRGSGFGFTYGTYVIRAKLPRGKHLFPSFYLLPLNQHLDKCKYEEIDVMEFHGARTSTLYFSAKYGRQFDRVYTRSISKVFGSDVDFSKDFHTFAIKWLPTRIEWYVDMMKVYEVNTHFVNDWRNEAGDNLPCSKSKKPFGQQSNLFLSLSVGGKYFPIPQSSNLTLEEATRWPKPTMEIDWVRIYNDKAQSRSEKPKPLFKRTGIEMRAPIGPLSTGYL